MKHSGKPLKSAMRIVFWTLVMLLAFCIAGWLAGQLGNSLYVISAGLAGLSVLFVCFIVSPGRGNVDESLLASLE